MPTTSLFGTLWRPLPFASALAFVSLAACIEPIGNGPDLGACAATPDGSYTWGEVGPGACLAGPVDVRFIDVTTPDGPNATRSLLVVSNADPYRQFRGGSLLAIDWDDLVTRFVEPGVSRVTMDQLVTSSVELPSYTGEIGYLPNERLMVVPSRISEEARTFINDDPLHFVRVNGAGDLVADPNLNDIILKDDPYSVVVDVDAGRTYVSNLTDHSISVLANGDPLRTIDLADAAALTPGPFLDGGRISTAELDQLAIDEPNFINDDNWTLSWIDGSTRLWLPAESGGLIRFSSGGISFTESAFGDELLPAASSVALAALDPHFATAITTPIEQIVPNSPSLMAYAYEGVLWIAAGEATPSTSWVQFVEPLLIGDGWDAFAGGPSLGGVNNRLALWYDGRVAEGAPASIGVSIVDDNGDFRPAPAPVITAPAGYDSVEQPFVFRDALTGRYRMYVTLRAGDAWSIGLTESDGGSNWGPLELVVGLPPSASEFEGAAGPVVAYGGSRYRMWFSTWDGQGWATAEAWSYDGYTWQDSEVVIPSRSAGDPNRPARAAMQRAETSAWRLEGAATGIRGETIPAGTVFAGNIDGYRLVIANGFEIGKSDLPDGIAAQGLIPGSIINLDGTMSMYATAISRTGRHRLVLLQRTQRAWVVQRRDLIPRGVGGHEARVESPVVFPSVDGYTLLYAATDGLGRTRTYRATSPDGRTFTASDEPVLEDGPDWRVTTHRPRSVVIDGEQVTVWLDGDNGSRPRIGAARSVDGGRTFTDLPGPTDPWWLEAGPVGGVDDSGARDPVVIVDGDTTHLWYTAFDGQVSHLAHAVLVDGAFVPDKVPGTLETRAAMSGQPRTFSTRGVAAPTAWVTEDGTLELWYAGFLGGDNTSARVGRSVVNGDFSWPHQRFPEVGDELTFTGTRGDLGTGVIELAQSNRFFVTDGRGTTTMTHDAERGFLYLPSKLSPLIYVIDVRDDSAGDFSDENYLDIEAMIQLDPSHRSMGFRDVVISASRGLMYVSSRRPEGIVVLNLDDIVDNATTELINAVPRAVLSMPIASEDRGAPTFAPIGPAGLAITPDERLLLVAHYRGNSVHVIDLTRGPFGEEIASIPWVGENPHVVRISPDGRYAAVANFTGELVLQQTSATLAIIGLDPNAPGYLDVVTTLVNK